MTSDPEAVTKEVEMGANDETRLVNKSQEGFSVQGEQMLGSWQQKEE